MILIGSHVPRHVVSSNCARILCVCVCVWGGGGGGGLVGGEGGDSSLGMCGYII